MHRLTTTHNAADDRQTYRSERAAIYAIASAVQQIDELRNAGRNAPVQIGPLPIGPKTERINEVNIRLAQVPTTTTRLAILWESKTICFPFPQILNSAIHWSLSILLYMNVRAGR